MGSIPVEGMVKSHHMIEADRQMQEEILRLTKENNRMLHSMRRNAFVGGIIKFLFYVFILVVAPLWLYSTYLAPLIQSVQQTMGQVQGTGTKAQGQLAGLEGIFKQFESMLPDAFQPKK